MKALVVDDEPQVRHFVVDVLREDGWSVIEADTAERAFELLREGRLDLVFCDVMLGGTDGFAVLRRFTEEQPEAHVVLMTGYGSALGALDATAFGAYDYLLKPFSVGEVQALAGAISRRLDKHAHSHHQGEDELAPVYTSDIVLVGRSAALVEVMKIVGRVALTNLPVLITGESGTGKEVVAQAIHRRSQRAAQAFIAVNCGALTAELIESELFGHMRGAFTGADRERVGLFEAANGGTIFLDEITETTPAFQVKLLRTLQQGEIRRVGSNQTLHVDVRVIAATNCDPEAEVQARRFRRDLLYRLNAVTINLPPLRERREDIVPLVNHFASRSRPAGMGPLNFTTEAMRLLESYHWPGNIRELENTIIRAAALSDHTVRPEDLPEHIRQTDDAPANETAVRVSADEFQEQEEWPSMAEVEGHYVARVLAHTGGNKQAASRLLGVDRKTLERMIKRHHIELR
jgi:two-component system, NtrC family, response regulator AtoC